MVKKIEIYRGVDIFGDAFRQASGGIPVLTTQYDATANGQIVHSQSLAGIKKQIDSLLGATT